MKALGPLGDREAELRDRLGREHFKVLCMGRVVECTAGGVLLISVLTASQGDTIRRDCEAELLAVTGASRLEFVIELPLDVPKLRRLP